MELSAQQIADFLGGTVDGNPEVKVSNFSKIEEGQPGTLTFLANPKYEHYIYNTEASIVLVNNDFSPAEQITATLVKVENAYSALAMLLNLVEQSKPKKAGISSAAFIAASATMGEDCFVGNFAYIGEQVKLGKNCQIYPNAYIGDGVTIGDNCILYPHTTIYNGCKIGNNCILHAGSVIGSDGFGFAPEGENYKKIPQLGNVVLEDNVEIGANTTIDRAVMGSTIIRRGPYDLVHPSPPNKTSSMSYSPGSAFRANAAARSAPWAKISRLSARWRSSSSSIRPKKRRLCSPAAVPPRTACTPISRPRAPIRPDRP